MGWTDCHARKAILDTVLARARIDPAGPLLLDGLPDVDRLFGGEDGVLLALHHRWATCLAAKRDQAVEDGAPPQRLWDELSAEQPTLRAVLDAAFGRSSTLRAERVARPSRRSLGGIAGWGQTGSVHDGQR
ncbi:hypothetical protein DEU38_12335 [Rhodococcus sp. AG1013]|nr:hypothetical protein DEU38_12335 [Rhodococcus sp. AG1013]